MSARPKLAPAFRLRSHSAELRRHTKSWQKDQNGKAPGQSLLSSAERRERSHTQNEVSRSVSSSWSRTRLTRKAGATLLFRNRNQIRTDKADAARYEGLSKDHRLSVMHGSTRPEGSRRVKSLTGVRDDGVRTRMVTTSAQPPRTHLWTSPLNYVQWSAICAPVQ